MTNRRELKQSINHICGELFAECVAAAAYSGKPDKENVQALLSSILKINSDYVNRISHPEPGMKPKVYFKHLIEDFNKQVGEIIDQIGNME